MSWDVRLENTFEQEFLSLEEAVREAILATARLLEDYGPQLGRPHVDTLEGSRYANMRELRFAAADRVWCVAGVCIPSASPRHAVDRRQQIRSETGAVLSTTDRSGRQTLCGAPRTAAYRQRIAGMGRTLREVLDTLPAASCERVDARYREPKAEVESLRALRKVAGKAQADIAAALHIKQPSVSKIEKQ